MRRFLKMKMSLLVLAVLAIVLTSGVVWATGSRGPFGQFGGNDEPVPEIVVIPMTVQAGTPGLTVLGSGFLFDPDRFPPAETVLFRIQVGDAPIFLGTADANENGALELVVQELSSSIEPGIYSVTGTSLQRTGLVVSYPLVVVSAK